MSSKHLDTPTVAQDAPARERLRDAETDVDGGGHGRIVTLDAEEFSIVAYIDHGADAGALHEGLASIWQTADDVMHLTPPDNGPDTGGDA